MGAVNSTILPLGTDAPDFSLPDPSGTVHSLDELARGAPALVVVFLSNHCPYVRRVASGTPDVTSVDLTHLAPPIRA